MAVSSVSPGLVNTALFRYALPDLHTDVSTGAVDDDAKLDKLYQVQGYFMTPAAKAAQIAASLNSGKPQVSSTRTTEFGPNVAQYSDDAILREVSTCAAALRRCRFTPTPPPP